MFTESSYWIVVLFIFIVLVYKYRRNSFFILILLFFWEGLFTYYGKTTWSFYKILLPVYAIYSIIQQQKFLFLDHKEKRLLYAFALFSVLFSISSYKNNDELLLFLNQYSRYLLAFLSYFLLKASINKGITFVIFNDLIFTILQIQIFLSVLNFGLMGVHENIVGSISSNGGSAAAVIPLLGFIFVWLRSRGIIKKKEWIYLLLLLFIGFVSMKRAIWILAPIIVLLLIYYVPKKKIGKNVLMIIILLPLIFYMGVRLNPTLNPEKKVWGSFDFDFFMNYSKTYTFGNENDNEIRVGRGGATLLTLESIFSPKKENSLLGSGLTNIYAWNENLEEDPNLPIKISDINSITMATGLFQNYYTGGILQVISFLLLMYFLFSIIKHRRFRIFLIFLFLWEYLLYANILMRSPALSFLLVYLICFSNNLLTPNTSQAKWESPGW